MLGVGTHRILGARGADIGRPANGESDALQEEHRRRVRAGEVRISFHVYNTDDHVEAAVETLGPLVKPP